jgi:hypothetical protein
MPGLAVTALTGIKAAKPLSVKSGCMASRDTNPAPPPPPHKPASNPRMRPRPKTLLQWILERLAMYPTGD